MAPPPWPVKIGQKKDGRRARRLIFHVSWPPLSEVSGSATATALLSFCFHVLYTCFQWDLVCEQDWLPPLVSTIFFAGVLIGVFLCGYASDKLVKFQLLKA